MPRFLLAVIAHATAADVFLQQSMPKQPIQVQHVEYMQPRTSTFPHSADTDDLCADSRVNKGSAIVVTETFYSSDILPDTLDTVECCSGKCSCVFHNSTLECQLPYDDVLTVTLKNRFAAVGGYAKQTSWTGYSSGCCGCATSGSGYLAGFLGKAVVFPLDFAPLVSGNVTDEGHCTYDPFFGSPCVGSELV